MSAMRRGILFGICSVPMALGIGLAGQTAPKPAPPGPKTVDFNRQVRPILAEHCWPCHGTDKAALEKTGGLRLDQFHDATKDRGGYRAITPGSPANSQAWLRITANDASKMPPEAPNINPLTPEKKRILQAWIRQGAEYDAHWAFLPPVKAPLPVNRDKNWAKNEIDRFVLQALERKGWKPEPEADRRTLARRASLTLTGLPPTPEEMRSFLEDKSPNAYERWVDRLLASPRYGEHQARFWLDGVRYADTHGLHIDNERAVFPYRDWVVRALNEDLPFDKFATWQLAGDLLPNPTTEQKIATGYIRMNPTTAEGGVIEEEFLVKNTADRLDTTATLFLGLTVACARCHDHKYDPISQREYYSLYAFFNSTTDPVLDGNLKLHQPVMKAPTPEQEERANLLEAKLQALEGKADLAEAGSWARANRSAWPAAFVWEQAGPYTADSFAEAFERDFKPQAWRKSGFRLDAAISIVGREKASGYLRTRWNAPTGRRETLRVSSDDGVEVFLNGKSVHKVQLERAIGKPDEVALDIPAGPNELVLKLTNSGGGDAIQVSVSSPEQRRIDEAAMVAEKPSATPAERRRLASAFLELGPSDAKEYREASAQRKRLEDEIPFTYIAQEMERPRRTRVLRRGEYNLPAEEVGRGVPAAIGRMPASAPRNRLGLAQWLTDPKHPLVSRVTVNRIWQQHFGHGIVKSVEDFGNRGDWPSHPELLDTLAVRFVERGWRMKDLHRLIVTSAAFRQSAAVSKTKLAGDPENRLVSRGPRFRLDAEVIRDSALAISGLLVERPGGRGDKPYQPAGLWEAIAYPISDTAKYVQDQGDALYRRSLYLFWKRTSPPATMMIFDAPMRESCQVRRSRTNTPMQALAAMNDPQFVEAARVMAQRALSRPGSDAERLAFVFERATGRLPSASEAEILLRTLGTQRKEFADKAEQAAQLMKVGEHPADPNLDPREVAAWTLLCNLVLNLDETLTQH